MVGAMTTALVISQSPKSNEFIRSDMIAAKVLQNAIKEGRGNEVLSKPAAEQGEKVAKEQAAAPQVARAEPKAAASVVAKSTDAGTATKTEVAKPDASKSTAAAGLYNSSAIQDMRERIADMTRALAGLKQAFEAMVGYNSMIMESDSATAIAYAGNMLTNVEREANTETASEDTRAEAGEGFEAPASATATSSEEAETAPDHINGLYGTDRDDFIVADADLVNRVEAGSANDGINAKGEIVRHVFGGEGGDGIMVQARRAVDINGGSGNDAVAVEAMKVWGVSGGSGDDKIHVMGKTAGNISAGTGDDKLSVQGGRLHDISAGSGDDVMTIVGDYITGVSDGDGDDTVSIVGGKVKGLMSSAGDDVYRLNVGKAEMSLRAGMGNDQVDLADGTHLAFALSESEMMSRGAMNAVWDGDTLIVNFESGDSLTINNAANAGSITMQSGGTKLTLMPPKTPAETGMLDIAI